MSLYTHSKTTKTKALLHQATGRIAHVLGALAMAFILLLFLSWMRSRESLRIPENTIRTVETCSPVHMPPPPPPEPRPPQQKVQLPELPLLEIQPNSIAPPLKALTQPEIDPKLLAVDFQRLSPPVQLPANLGPITYGIDDLDARPVLINHPSVSYPAALARQGVLRGRVVLEVIISPDGRVRILKFVSCEYPELERMARRFAARARFSSPKKNGIPVTATYRWPLVLKH